MFTRKQYMAGECTHRQYYAQFVNNNTKGYLLGSISEVELIEATRHDEGFNSIPLKRWDMTTLMFNRQTLEAAGDTYTMAGKVCILKEAAKQIIEYKKITNNYVKQ